VLTPATRQRPGAWPTPAGGVDVPERTHTCLACGASFEGRRRKFCYSCLCPHASDPDRYAKQYRRLLSGLRRPVARPPGAERQRATACERCGVEFVGRQRGQRFCSKECRYPPRRVLPRRSECVWCRQPFPERSQSKVYCSKACQAGAVANLAKYGAADRCHLPVCIACDAVGGRRKLGSRYCDACRPVAIEETRGRAEALRRAAERAGDGVTWHDLWEGYGGRCDLCGCRCDPGQHWTHPRYPTKDHVIPISAGGEDVRANVRLVCRDCNLRRGAGGGGEQLRLVG